MTIPDDIVVLSEPGPQLFTYPDWANYALVTVQAGSGGAGTGGPGQPGGKATFLVRIRERTIPIEVGAAGRDWDGVRRAPNGYSIIELYRERPNV